MAAPPPDISLVDFRKFSPLNGLREESLVQLHKRVKICKAKAGSALFKVGSANADSFYLIRGDVDFVDHGGTVVRSLRGGTPDAQHRLAHQTPRKVEARCRSEVEYIQIDSSLLDVMLTWDQTGNFEVDELDADDDAGDWMTRLLQMKAFQKVPPANLQAMFMRLEPMEVSAGTVVIRQGDDGDFFYVMTKGRAMVTRETPTSPKPIKLAELEAGSCFGEEALISDDKRNASITMLENGSLMRLAKTDFQSLLTAPLTKQVALDEARGLVEAGGAVWLDVRLPSEFKDNHLPDAVNIPLFMLRPKLPSLDKTKTYVVYCDGGRRSSVAAFVLTQKGYEAQVLKGGIPPQEAAV